MSHHKYIVAIAAFLITTAVAAAGLENRQLADMAAETIKMNQGISGKPEDVAIADLTEEATPSAGDMLVGFNSLGAIKKFDVNGLSDGNGIYTANGTLPTGNNRVFTLEGTSQFQIQGAGSSELFVGTTEASIISGAGSYKSTVNGLEMNFGAAKDLLINSSSGTSGQVLSSSGVDLPPAWRSVLTAAGITASAAQINELDLSGLTVGDVYSADAGGTAASWKAQDNGIYSTNGLINVTRSVTLGSTGVFNIAAADGAGFVVDNPNDVVYLENGTTFLEVQNSAVDVNAPITTTSTVDGRDVSTDGTNQDAHLALTGEHIDWTAASAGTIDPSNYAVDGDGIYDGGTGLLDGNTALQQYSSSGITSLFSIFHNFDTQLSFNVNGATDLRIGGSLGADGEYVKKVAGALAWGELVEADISDLVHTTNTDAESKCIELESLRGNGTCVVPGSGGGSGGGNLTTKGDLEAYDTAQTRLPVGADNYILTADSTTASGLGWKAQKAITGATSGISVTLSGTQSITAGVQAKVAFVTEEWDIDNEHVSGTYTAKKAGYIEASGQLTFNVTAAGDQLNVFIKVNGVNVSNSTTQASDANNQVVSFNKLLNLAINDTVEIHVQNANSNDTLQSASYGTFWQMIQPATYEGDKLPTSGVVAYLTSDEAIGQNVPEQLDTFTEVVDYGSDFNAATGVYTVPTTGKYETTFQTAFGAGVAELLYVSIYNEGALESLTRLRASNTFNAVRAYAVIDATAGDEFTFKVTNGNAADVVFAGNFNTFVIIKPWIGSGTSVDSATTIAELDTTVTGAELNTIATDVTALKGRTEIYRVESISMAGSYDILTTDTVGVHYDASTTYTHTPIATGSTLMLDLGAFTESRKEAESNRGHQIWLTYKDSAGAWQQKSRIFYSLSTGDDTALQRLETKLRTAELDSSHFNSSGNWEFKLTQTKVYSGNSTFASSAYGTLTEYKN